MRRERLYLTKDNAVADAIVFVRNLLETAAGSKEVVRVKVIVGAELTDMPQKEIKNSLGGYIDITIESLRDFLETECVGKDSIIAVQIGEGDELSKEWGLDF